MADKNSTSHVFSVSILCAWQCKFAFYHRAICKATIADTHFSDAKILENLKFLVPSQIRTAMG